MSPALRTRTPRSRRRRDTEPALRVATKALLVLATVGAFVYLGVSSYNGVPFEPYRSLTVRVPEVGNLIQHDPVRIGGVRVGQVTGEDADAQGHAEVRLQIDPGTRIPVGTQAMIRTNGLLGARYVQLIPGHGRRSLPDGATLVAGASSLSYGVPEALSVLDAHTRAGLGQMLNGLGTGVLGRGEALNAAIHEGAAGAANFTLLANRILAPTGSAARLFPALDSTMAALDAVRGQIAAVPGPAARALDPLVSERANVRSALSQAPLTLATADRGLGAGETLLASAGALARAAQGTLPLLPGGLRDAAALMRSSPAPLAQADALLQQARPAIPAALRITSRLSPVLPPLRQTLERLSPILVYAGPRGCDLENFGVTLRSMTGFGGVGSGPLGPPMEFRAQMVAGPEAFAQLGSAAAPPHDAYAAPCKYVDSAAALGSTAVSGAVR